MKAAGILFTDGSSILMLKRSKQDKFAGTWGFPGGKAREKETKFENAVRETKEETGLKIIPGQQFGNLTLNDFTVFFYRVGSPFKVTVSSEHSEAKWIKISELSKTNLYPVLKKQLPEFLKIVRKKTTKYLEWIALTDIICS